MLNPKLIERYGESTREMFTRMAEEIGVELASQCYISKAGFMSTINGVRLPDSMTTMSDKIKDIQWAIHTFSNKYYRPGEEFWITVFKEEPGEEDLQLWVC